jgi:hypothetical protein
MYKILNVILRFLFTDSDAYIHTYPTCTDDIYEWLQQSTVDYEGVALKMMELFDVRNYLMYEYGITRVELVLLDESN